MVESGPHEAVVAEAEDKEVAWGSVEEDGSGDGDFFECLLWGYGGGGVMDESVGK